jgi:hypothetical protein
MGARTVNIECSFIKNLDEVEQTPFVTEDDIHFPSVKSPSLPVNSFSIHAVLVNSPQSSDIADLCGACREAKETSKGGLRC